jgi:orotidine-5'-phosphate decarboxylase
MTDFKSKLEACSKDQNSLLCIGLDPDIERLPAGIADGPDPLYQFSKAIIDATQDLVCAYKPNTAFFEAHGEQGIRQLHMTCQYLRDTYPHIPIVLDFKRGDIGNTNNYYAQFAFDYLGADAVTISPYLGKEAVQPFLDRTDKGIFILCRTSNQGSGEFQDIDIDGRKLYQVVAEHIARQWNGNQNCMLVTGATYPEELADVRSIVGPDMLLLIPGIGTQGGSVADTLQASLNADGNGVLINSSREILYASRGNDFVDAARTAALRLRDDINKYR